MLTPAPSSIDPNPRNAAYGALVLRLALGAIFIAHGLFKLVALGLPATAAFFESVGYPGWTAYPVFLIEVAGGLALALGIHARLAAAALLPVALGALRVHGPNGWFFGSPGGGWEFIAFLAAALVAALLIGPGPIRAARRVGSPR